MKWYLDVEHRYTGLSGDSTAYLTYLYCRMLRDHVYPALRPEVRAELMSRGMERWIQLQEVTSTLEAR